MKEIIKRKEIKGILVSILLIILGVFLIVEPDKIVATLLRIMGIFALIMGAFDITSYFFSKNNEGKLFDYGLFKGVLEITMGILFVFKYDSLITIFYMILGIIIIFINLFKLQTSLNLKELNYDKYTTGAVIAGLSIILGVVIVLNPFETSNLVIILSGGVLVVSEIANIIYSLMILKHIKNIDKVVKDITISE